jgi:DNA mismatch repair protein MutS2
MDEKTLYTLEYPKILERLAGHTAFAVSADKARALRPTTDPFEARRLQAEVSEAFLLLDTHPDLTIGGARDVRQPVDLASHGGVLTPVDLLDVKSTLIAGRNLTRLFERLEGQYPRLSDIASQMAPPVLLVDAITRTISDRGEVLDSASRKLGTIRHDMRIAHDRLLTKMQRMVSDPKVAPFLQEGLVTQRDGRYVLPLRAEFKGRVRAIVHDQSASGATLFVEPFGVVDMNNQYRELQLAERDEERRILAELSLQIGSHAEAILHMVEVIAELDLALARAKFGWAMRASEPVLREFSTTQKSRTSESSKHPGSLIRLYGARHPLLDPATVVPVDVDLDDETFVLVITGPNTGGKTVTLKTVGLLALMAQSGLHIPAEPGSEISVFEEILADIGDEQSIEQSLSTFSGHITNIVRILEEADRRSLVILDELGAGTDPQEGAALARALLTHLLDRGITTLVTTHHPELKAFAHARAGVTNASVEFDLETLQPTFRVTIGLPGRSNALAIAQRLGMPEAIITSARAELSPEEVRAEDLLDEILRQRDLARETRAESERARQEIEGLRVELAEQLEKVEDERRAILESARTEAARQVENLRVELETARRALASARPLRITEVENKAWNEEQSESLQEVEQQVDDLEAAFSEPVGRRIPVIQETVLQRPIRLGDRVRLRSLNTQGVVSALGEEEVEVQVGGLRVRTRLAEVIPVAAEAETEAKPARRKRAAVEPASEFSPASFLPSSPGMELDLRGQRADDALDALERYLDGAFLAGLPFVRVIHGKGTGKLRQAVREAMGQHPHVRSFEPGGEKEGGDGVTVAKLETS